jgi:hypothetical protein
MYTMQTWIRRLSSRGPLAAILAAAAVAAFSSSALADSAAPSGERLVGQTAIEPAYDDADGSLMYLLTPIDARTNANPDAVSPLYIIVYPNSAASSVGTMNCAHNGGDNCPDHGPEVAWLAASMEPGVYGAPDGSGVWGHDHIGDAPGGADFNVAWVPVAVLFTNSDAANTHITTEDQLDAALAAGDVIEIPLPELTFNCSAVSAHAYDLGAPVPATP